MGLLPFPDRFPIDIASRVATVIPLTELRNDAHGAFVRGAALAPAVDGPVVDQRRRAMHDLRISVTDRCNFRCVYCMPKDVFGRDYPFLPHDALLTFEEITRVARVYAGLGVRKIRLTGGEPLLRRNLERLVAQLRTIPDVELTLTTNGVLLARKAAELRAAGLDRVTVSLDALDEPTFRAMNDVDFPVAKVLEGIEAAASAGLAPVKVNTVVKRGMNEHAIVDLARHFKGTGHIVRFIEYMDVGATNGWRMNDVVSAQEIVQAIDRQMPLVRVPSNYPGEVAQRWAHADGSGEIGVIASVTQAFCGDCTRARLSTEGSIYTCLFANDGFDLRALLRGGYDDAALSRAAAAIWRQRDDHYSEARTANTARAPKVEMSYIGG